ncbi:hypothetical protein ACHAWF_005526 [Thalassiosira exigua]
MDRRQFRPSVLSHRHPRHGLRRPVDEFDDIFPGIMAAFDISSDAYVGPVSATWNTGRRPIAWLLFHAEMLVFVPQWHTKDKQAVKAAIDHWLSMLRCGHIKRLWLEAMLIKSRMPCSKPQSPDPSSPDKSIQKVAYKDNWSTVYARAVKPQKIAAINNTRRQTIKGLYPPSLPSPDPPPSNPPPPSQATPILRELPGDLVRSIRKLKRGKANGLFCDSLDTFIRIAKSNNPWAHKALRRLFCRV